MPGTLVRATNHSGWLVGIAALIALALLLTWPLLTDEPQASDGGTVAADFSLEYAFDPRGIMTIDDLMANPNTLDFTAAPQRSLHVGFSPDPLWLRVTITNPSDRAFDGVLVDKFPYTDSITAFVPAAGRSALRRIVRGDSEPLPDELRYSHFPAFPVHVAANASAVAYLKIRSSSVLVAPLSLSTQDRFTRDTILDQVLLSLMFGAVIAVCLYVLTVYLTVRDKAYLDFVPFSLSYAAYVAVATGMGQTWLWPHAFAQANTLYFVVQGLLFASGARFFQRYLRTREHTPRINAVLRLMVIAGLLTTVSPFLPHPVDKLLIAFIAGPGAILILCTAIYLWMKRVDNADVVTVGWAFSHITSVFLYLRVFDITPYLEVNHYLTAIGCTIATLYFAVALALGLRRQQAKLLLAEAVNDTRNQFLAGMSHELRTPLNAIMGFSEMMKTEMLGPIQPSAYRTYAEDIHHSSRNMLRLVDDVLDISRIEAGQHTLSRQPTDLIALAQQNLARFAPVAEHSGVGLHLEHDMDSLTATVDAEAISKALGNILDNAIKYARPDGRVTVEVAATRGQIRLSVADDGVGIPAGMMERIVRPFELVRVNAYSAKDGAGLGLPLARMLVELHGGKLEIESAEDQGTRVTFLLPD